MANQMVGSRDKYQYLTGYNSDNYNGSASIDAIVIHHWGNDGQDFYNVIAALSGAREASAHYVLQDNLVACIIAPGLRAWHVEANYKQEVMPGIYDVNSHTIGIECCPEMTAGDLETLCQLIADLWVDYGKVPLYGHQDFMATACPGRYYGKMNYIRHRAEEIYNEIIGGAGDQTETDEQGMVKVVLHGYERQIRGVNVNGSVYVSIRDLLSMMGYDVGWGDGKVTVEYHKGEYHKGA